KARAPGFLLIAACSISICLSTCDSFSGPSNLIVTLYCAAAFSAPCRTACQNWCWKPFEIIGMNGLAAALGLLLLVLAGVPPQAAATKTTAANPPNQRGGLPLMFPPLMLFSPTRGRCTTHHLPDTIWGCCSCDGIPSTRTDIRRAPVLLSGSWERDGRLLAPREGLSTFSCFSSSAARTA